MARTARTQGSVGLDDLKTILEALESISDEAGGVGELTSCRIVIELDGTRVTCTWVNREWEIKAS